MKRIGVMQLTDTLEVGGLERVAVNLANSLPVESYDSHLCATRCSGPLRVTVLPHVRQLYLDRSGRFDLRAVRRLINYTRSNGIQILHAHGTAVFISALAGFFDRDLQLIWHVHFGRYAIQSRSAALYRLGVRSARAVIAVNEPLAEWSRKRLRVPQQRVHYIPNFVCEPPEQKGVPDLPGAPGSRIVCVANLRPEKDHLTLLAAMKEVISRCPAAHLLVAGSARDGAYARMALS